MIERGQDLRGDARTVLTLDAGGTNFVFSAIAEGREVVAPTTYPSQANDLDACLATLVRGFSETRARAPRVPVAISFAFPGPADYPRGIIGDLPNLPAFRGGIALGPMLEERFGLPTFINNDGDLFTLGEAIGGLLPEVNHQLEAVGSPRRFRNLLGATIGTGFGGGIVRDCRLFVGDNSAAGEIWLMRHKHERQAHAEEGVSIRGVKRVYTHRAGLAPDGAPEPKDIARIARGEAPGDQDAAREAFRMLGEVAGDALAQALTLIDGLLVVGGGLSAAHDLFLPALVAELNGTFSTLGGTRIARLATRAFSLEDPDALDLFLRGDTREIPVPGTAKRIAYDPLQRVGVGISRLGTSTATALGAYAFALGALDNR